MTMVSADGSAGGVDGDGKLLTVANVARDLNVHQKTVRQWCHYGLLPAIKVDGRWLIHPKALAAFVAEHRGGAREANRPE